MLGSTFFPSAENKITNVNANSHHSSFRKAGLRTEEELQAYMSS